MRESYVIIIENLIIEAIIGILPSERMRSQRVEICLEVTYNRYGRAGRVESRDSSKAGEQAMRVDSSADSSKDSEQKGDESAFLDYALVRDMLVGHLQESQYGLLEDALDGSIAMLKAAFPTITHITLTLKKPDILAPCCVGMRKSTAFI